MYRTAEQIDFVGAVLASFYPSVCTRIDLPEPSVQGRPVYAYRLRGGSGPQRRGVLLVGGTHARELMNPDMLIELVADLIVSYVGSRDIVLGGRTWTAREVEVMLDSLDVYVLPCVNPDGRDVVLTTDSLWRKNLRDNPGTGCDGVDLNRNAAMLWGVAEGQTSCSPCAETFVGSGSFSEPETRNVRWLLDTYRVDTFVDVHSYAELVLHPWGHAPNQTSDPSENFTTLPTGTCAPISAPGYGEYIDPRDLARFETVGQRIVEAVAAVRGRTYTREPGFSLYGTTGTLSDYAYARHIATPGAQKTYGFTIECGPWQGSVLKSFQPDDPEPVKDETESGVLALIQQSICAIEVVAATAVRPADEVDTLRRVRDELLATTPAGRAWIELFEGLQLPLVTAALADRRRRETAGELVAVAAALAADPDAVLERPVVERAVALLRDLDAAVVSRPVAAGIATCVSRLEQMTGRRAGELMGDLMRQGPGSLRR